MASSTGEADETFPVLLPQTPKARATTRSRAAATKDKVAEANADLTVAADTTTTTNGRPRRGAARAAQTQITKTVNEKLTSKKRRPTDNDATVSDSTLVAASSTSSLNNLTQKTVSISVRNAWLVLNSCQDK